MPASRDASITRARWRKALRDAEGLTMGAKLAGFVISEDTGNDLKAWPSLRRIARFMGISERSARRYVTEACRAGWLSKTLSRTPKGYLRAEYQLSTANGIELSERKEVSSSKDLRGEAADLVKEHLWQGEMPPSYPHAPKGQKWSMRRELSVLKTMGNEFGYEEIVACIPRIRSFLALGDAPCTLAILNGNRGRLRELLHLISEETLARSGDGKASTVRMDREPASLGRLVASAHSIVERA